MGQVTVTLSGDEQRLLRSLDRVLQKERELARKSEEAGEASARGANKAARANENLGRGLGRVEKNQDQAFGSRSLNRMGVWAAKVFGVQKAVQAVVDTLEEAERLTQSLAEGQRDAEGGFRRLAQLGGGDPNRVRELSRQARAVAASGATDTLSQAADLVFQLESAGINTPGTREIFGKLGGVISDPVGFARSAKTIQAALGADETGDIRGILGKAFAASGASPAQAPALLQAAAGAGAFAKELGISDEESLAAVARTATTTGSAEQGGTQVRALLKAIGRDAGAREAVTSGGLAGGIRELERRGLTKQGPFEAVFGKRAEAFLGLSSILGGLGGIEEQIGVISEAEGDDLAGSIADSADADPLARVARARRVAQTRKELAGEAIGLKRNLVDTAIERQEAKFLREGSTFKAGAVRTFSKIGRSALGQATGFGATDDENLKAAAEEGFITTEEMSALREVQGGGGGIGGGMGAAQAFIPFVLGRLIEDAEIAQFDAAKSAAKSAAKANDPGGLLRTMFPNVARGQDAAAAELSRLQGRGGQASARDILNSVGGEVGQEGIREALENPRAAKANRLLDSIREGIADMRAPTLSEPDES